MILKRILQEICPPFAWELTRRLLHARKTSFVREGNVFEGDYASWEAAERASGGYAAAEILTRTRAAMLRVKSGEAAFERDSVVLLQPEYPFPIIVGLLRAAMENGGKLSVLDFGGALGSTYFQCRKLLGPLVELRWSIVEQKAHVACGAAEFENNELRFYLTVDECLNSESPQVLLLSSVLQYLPDPYSFLADTLQHRFSYITVDRTAFDKSGRDRLTVQQVPSWIYQASYPAWFLSEQSFLSCIIRQYDLLYDFSNTDIVKVDCGEAYFKGFHFQIKTGASSV